MSVPSDITTFGHLVLSMHPTNYAIKLPTAFPLPINPGLGPTISHRVTTSTITQAHFTYKVEKKQHDTYHVVDRAIKTQILKATLDMFTKELYDKDIGYTSVKTRELLQHLWATYVLVDHDHLAANITCMSTPWSPPTPIDTLFKKIEK